MASLRPAMFALVGVCLVVLVSCKADYPVYHYQQYYPHEYYPSYSYKYDPTHTHKTYSVIPSENYPVYHTADYFPHKGTHYVPHADYHVYPYSGWPHHQQFTYDHDWYGYHGEAPVHRPTWPHAYSSPNFNVYNRFDGGLTSQRSDAKADASSSSGGTSVTSADTSAEPSSSGSGEAPSSSASAESPAGHAPSGKGPVFGPRLGLWSARPSAAPVSVSLPLSLRNAWRTEPAAAGPQSDAAWNFVAGDSPATARWFPRSGYKHIDHVRPKEPHNAHHP